MEKKALSSICRILAGAITVWLISGLCAGFCGQIPETTPGKNTLFNAFVYFAGPGRTHLKAASKQLPASADAHQKARMLLKALTDGPSSPELGRTLPDGTSVNTLFITGTGDAYVDLLVDRDSAGATDTLSEYMAVYSLVNTLAVNIEQIQRVKIILNGKEGQGFGRHISLEPFFNTNMLIVK